MNDTFHSAIKEIQITFRDKSKTDWLTVLIFVALNVIQLYNSLFHDPFIGYDARGHLGYILALSRGNLVSPHDTHEFFSPPLPYLLPSLSLLVFGVKITTAAKIAQLINFGLSLGLSFLVLKIISEITPRIEARRYSLLVLALFPVYYKTFSFIRGEPYVAFFSVLSVLYLLRIIREKEINRALAIKLGLTLGFCALSRQWGIFVIFSAILSFAIFLFKNRSLPLLKSITLCLCITFLTSSWFYFSLLYRFGSLSAFARSPTTEFSLKNQPSSFYFSLGYPEIFLKPLRPSFCNQFIPIMYSEVWGDYWGYFMCFGKKENYLDGSEMERLDLYNEGKKSDIQTNLSTMGKDLGRLNLVSLLPSALIFVSLVYTALAFIRKKSQIFTPSLKPQLFLFYSILVITLTGYLWFCIRYPNYEKGDTIKASYLLHLFPFTAIIVGLFLNGLHTIHPKIVNFIFATLLLCFAHSLPFLTTNYFKLPW